MSDVHDAPPVLTLLGRSGCHLCADMRAVLSRQAARFCFVLEEVDISGKQALEARYAWDIPVLLAGEVEIMRHFFDQAAWHAWWQARASGSDC